MAAYQGAGQFPYWMTVANTGGLTNAGIVSENAPVQAGTSYQFEVICSFASSWASGATVFLTFYNSGGTALSAFSSTPSSMTGGVLYVLNTGLVTAPANSSYCVATIQMNGAPGSSNPLSVYQAEIDDQNYNQVNVNYTFSWTFWPWTALSPSTTLGWASNPLITGDSDSLVIDGIIELMGGLQGVQCDVPELADSNGQGPTFRILAPPSMNSTAFGYESSYDLNAPQPTQDVVASMLLDGERPFGTRASNRTITLPVVIFGTMAGGMNQVLKAREYLMSVIDQQYWQMKWTPADTGLAMLFDCFRALPSTPSYGFNYSAGGSATGATIGRPNYPIAMITLTIQALPYGRSDIDGVQTLAFSNPVVNGAATSAATVIDNFTTVFSPPPVINTPAWTNLGTANPTSVSSFSLTTGNTAAQGSTVIVEIEAAANTVTGVTDSVGNVYTLIGSQTTGGACWQFVYLAQVSTTLPNGGTITVTASGSGNFSCNGKVVTGAWALRGTPVKTNGTASSYSSNLTGLSPYDMLLSCSFGLGSSGSSPSGFTGLGTNSGNGLSNNISWYAQPINQTALSLSVSSLPNPYGLLLFALQPVNQYWSQDIVKGLSGDAVHYAPPRPMQMPWPAAAYSHTLSSAVSVVSNPVLSVWFGQAYDTQWPKDPKFTSNVTLHWTLTDNQGRTLNFSVASKKVKYGASPASPKWTRISALIPQGKTFSYNAVTGYSVRITNWSGSGHTGYVRMHCWLNAVTSNPQTIQNPMSPRGSLYNLFSLPGSARSPISVQCQLPAAANISKEITGPSTGYWTVPPGVYSVQAEGWAGGGAGSAVNLNRAICGGGGGGGEYAQEPALPVIPGQRVPWSVGAAGTPGQLASTIIQYTKDGLGHWTCPANVTSLTAEVWGAGAAGGAGSGGGGGAEYARARIAVVPGTTYSLWVPKGGKADTGTSASQVAARQGGTAWFGPPGNQVGSTAYVQANGGSTALTGASSGGLGGSSGTAAPQSQASLIGFSNPSAAKTFTFSPNTGTKLLPQGGAGLVIVSVPSAATVTVADSSQYGGAPSKWVQAASSSVAGATTYAFLNISANVLNASGVITVTQSVSQAATIGLFSLPWICGQDSVVTTASGTSAAPSIASSTPANTGDLVFTIFSSVTANTNSAPSGGWNTSLPNLGTSLYVNAYCIQNSGSSPETATAGYAVSQNWNAISFSFSTQLHCAGGRGGASPGPSGGGGGGAAGATGAGKAGGDSQPFQAGFARLGIGGTGGAGTGLGGAGGAGANTPGFPVAGTAPGGGGGGGYQAYPLFSPQQPSVILPGSQQVNFLGGDGGNGMVQLTYAVGNGSPVNGGNTSFGSAAATGTVLTANGGTSAANNSASGGNGGTGSSNTIHNAGGSGGLVTSGAMGSYIATARTSVTTLQSLSTMTYNATGSTSGASASSCSQGVAIAVIESTAKVSDLTVTDSAGNIYQELGVQQAGASANGVTAYAYVANIEYAVTTATTLTVTSTTSQQYGVIWYASPYLTGGVTTGNSGSGSGTGTAASAQFGTSDMASVEIELGIVLNDNSKTYSLPGNQGKVWAAASSTASLSAGSMAMSAYITQNQGGGTGTTGTGDIFSATLSASANWAVLCVPLTTVNQQAAMPLLDWRSGAAPGAQTSWASELAISANGMIVVAGQCGTGSGITAGPSAVSDAAGNVYTIRNTTVLPANGGVAFLATAPVTNALAAGTTGAVNWGSASAAPAYWTAAYWVPNAIGVDANGVSAVTGSASAVSGSYTPASPNDQVIALQFNTSSLSLPVSIGAPWNFTDSEASGTLYGEAYAAQATDNTALTLSGSLSGAASWALLMLGLTMQLSGTGGGAAGGEGTAGYSGVWQYGGPGYAGGGSGKGGAGAGSLNTAGAGAATPGGGGGGAYGSTTAGTEGGQGAPGALRLTWAPPLQAFNTLIVHSLSAGSNPNVNPIVTIPITDVPNNTEYCQSTDTEILTTSGWRFPADLDGTETALTLNMRNGMSEWQPLKAVHVFSAIERQMMNFESAEHSSLSTMDHRWAVKSNGKLRIQRSRDLTAWSGIVRSAACVDLPSEAKHSDAMVELVAWYTTEGNRPTMRTGNLSANVNIGQSHKVNEPYVARIRAALTTVYGPPVPLFTRYGEEAQWRESRTKQGMTIFYLNYIASFALTALAPGKNRVVQESFVTSLTKAQLALFLGTCLDGDNSGRNGSTQYIAQKVAARLDAMEIAALLLGHSTNRYPCSSAPSMTMLSIGSRACTYPARPSHDNTRQKGFSAEKVTRTVAVWCPETDNGTWLARRNGKTFFTGNTVPSVTGLLPAAFSSTYTVLLANYYWNAATVSSPRQITVTVNQYEYPGGPRYSVQVTRALTPATDVVNGLISMGEVTLPVKDYAAYNDQSYFTISVNDTDTGDRFMDVLFLDTQGQTVLINIDPGQPGYGEYVNFFIDEATPDRDLGFVGASFQDRQHQVSVLDYSQISGGALYIAPGDNLFLTYSTSGAPDLAVQYSPRWHLDRSV